MDWFEHFVVVHKLVGVDPYWQFFHLTCRSAQVYLHFAVYGTSAHNFQVIIPLNPRISLVLFSKFAVWRVSSGRHILVRPFVRRSMPFTYTLLCVNWRFTAGCSSHLFVIKLGADTNHHFFRQCSYSIKNPSICGGDNWTKFLSMQFLRLVSLSSKGVSLTWVHSIFCRRSLVCNVPEILPSLWLIHNTPLAFLYIRFSKSTVAPQKYQQVVARLYTSNHLPCGKSLDSDSEPQSEPLVQQRGHPFEYSKNTDRY